MQSMHWAVRNKKEPMLEAPEAEKPITSQAEDPHFEQEAPETPPYEATPPSSKAARRLRNCLLWPAVTPLCT